MYTKLPLKILPPWISSGHPAVSDYLTGLPKPLPSLLLLSLVVVWGPVLWHACARCPEGLWYLISDLYSGRNLHYIHHYLHSEVSESLGKQMQLKTFLFSFDTWSRLLLAAILWSVGIAPWTDEEIGERAWLKWFYKWEDLWRFQTYLPLSCVKGMKYDGYSKAEFGKPKPLG